MTTKRRDDNELTATAYYVGLADGKAGLSTDDMKAWFPDWPDSLIESYLRGAEDGRFLREARLIAAAPDLLAALREVVTWAHNPDPDGGAGAAMWERARAAIRKATEAR
jgi:hypothetical protein